MSPCARSTCAIANALPGAMRAIFRALSLALIMVTLLDASSLMHPDFWTHLDDASSAVSSLDTANNADAWKAECSRPKVGIRLCRNHAHEAGASALKISGDRGRRRMNDANSAAKLAMKDPKHALRLTGRRGDTNCTPKRVTQQSAMKDPKSALRLVDNLLAGWANRSSNELKLAAKLASLRSISTSFELKLKSMERVNTKSSVPMPWKLSSNSKKATPPAQIKFQPVQAPEPDLFDILFFDMGGIGVGDLLVGSLFSVLFWTAPHKRLNLSVGNQVCMWVVGLFLYILFYISCLHMREDRNMSSVDHRDEHWKAGAYHALRLTLVSGALSCLSFVYNKYKEQKNRAIAMQFVDDLVEQERKSDGKGPASTKKQQARATGAAAPARQRKERSATKRGAEEPAQRQASEPAAATATQLPKRKGRSSNKTSAPAAASPVTRCQQEAEAKRVSKARARDSAGGGSAAGQQPPKQLMSQQKNNKAVPSSRQQSKQPMTSSPSSSDPSNNAEQSDLCVVCLDGRCTHVFVPCGHLCICSSCADMVTQTDLQECPMCRVPSQSVMRVYTI